MLHWYKRNISDKRHELQTLLLKRREFERAQTS